MIPRHLQIGVAVLLVAVLVMAFYLRRMRRETESRAADTRPVTAPVAGPKEQLNLYVAYDDPGVLHPQAARIALPAGRQQRAQELLRALLQVYLDKTTPHALPAGADIRDVYMVDPGLAVIDLNPAFANGHRSGVLIEELTVASLVQTLTANVPGISRVKILVDGKERETLAGHADLTQFFDTAAMNRTSQQLASGPQ